MLSLDPKKDFISCAFSIFSSKFFSSLKDIIKLFNSILISSFNPSLRELKFLTANLLISSAYSVSCVSYLY